MNNSFQVKYRELWLLVLFLLIILEMCSSAALECAACVCLFFFLQKTVSLGKNQLKICKPMRNEEPMKNCETVRKALNPCDTWWNCESWEVCKWFMSKWIPHHQWPSITYTNKSHSRESFFFLKKIWYLGTPIFLSLFFLSFFASSKESLNLLLVGMNGWSVKSLLLMKLEGEGLSDNGSLWNFLTSFFKTSMLLFIELAWRKMINCICIMSIYYLNEISFTILTFF